MSDPYAPQDPAPKPTAPASPDVVVPIAHERTPKAAPRPPRKPPARRRKRT